MSCKKILVLPNYKQISHTHVLVQRDANSSWELSDYQSEIPSDVPKGVATGLPSLIVHQNNRPEFVLGRLVRQANPMVFLATQAGQDVTGRIVFLTLVTQGPVGSLGANEENLHIPDEAIAVLENDPNSPVPSDKIQSLKDAARILNQRGDKESQNALTTMWKNFQSKQNYNYFTSVSFRKASAFPPDSERACFGGGAPRPLSPGLIKNKYVVTGAVVLLLFLLLKQYAHYEAQQQKQAAATQETAP